MTFKKHLYPAIFLVSLGLASGARAQVWNADTFAPVLENDRTLLRNLYPLAYPGAKVLISSSNFVVNGKIETGRLIRLNADGSTDPTFNPARIGALLVYADGRILVSTHVDNHTSTIRLERLLGTGAIDPSFAATIVDYDYLGPKLLPDGRIVISGNFSQIDGVSVASVAILLANGGRDPSFQSPVAAGAPAAPNVTPTSDGQKLILSGNNLILSGMPATQVARVGLDGTVDTTFHSATSFSYGVAAVFPLAGGGMLVSGGNGLLVRLTSTGATDSSYTPALVGSPGSFGPRQANGSIIYFTNITANVPRYEYHRLNADGTDDAAFSIPVVALDSILDAPPLVACDDGSYFIAANSTARYYAHLPLGRVLANGTIDPNYNPRISVQAPVILALRQADGKIILGGAFSWVNNVAAPAAFDLVRFNSNGTVDASFNASLGTGQPVAGVALSNGKLLVQGYFPTGPSTSNSVIRLNADGSSDSTFQPITAPGVAPLSVDKDGYIYEPATQGSTPVARFTPDGAPDPTFQPAVNWQSLKFLTPLADGAVLVGKQTTSGPQLIRLLHGGAIDPNFVSPNLLQNLAFAAPLPDGSAAICEQDRVGPYTYYASVRRMRANGSIDYSFIPPIGNTNYVGLDTKLEIAGALFDLLREASPSAPATVAVSSTASTIGVSYVVTTDGLLIAIDPSANGGTLAYTRSTLTSPSVTAVPGIAVSLPITPVTRPTDSFFGIFGAVASGLNPTYQWYRDGVLLPGKNLYYLSLTHLQPSDSGNYTVVAKNAFGSANSPAFPLTVNAGESVAVVVTSPVSQTVLAGNPVIFSVVATGNPAPTYQWYFNNTPISGATSPTLNLTNVQSANAGTYAVNITSHLTSYTFSTQPEATLTVVPLSVGNPTANLTVPILNAGASASFDASSSTHGVGTALTGYSWNFGDGTAVVSGTSATQTHTYASAGNYTVTLTVTDSSGLTATRTATAAVAPGAGSIRIFFGTLGAGGQFALYVDGKGRGTMIGYLPGGRGNVATSVTVATDGTFSTTFPTSAGGPVSALSTPTPDARPAATLTLNVQILGASISGSIASTGESLSGSLQGTTGTTAGLAGLYQAPVVRSGNTVLDFIVGTNGNVMAARVDGNPTVAVLGTVSSAGQFAIDFGGTVSAQGSFGGDAAVTGQFMTNGIASTFGGVSATTAHTDRLVNISTRGLVGDADKAMIAGFVITGPQSKSVLVRASGPTLGSFGLTGTMTNPVLQIYRGADEIASNDGWSTSTDASLLASTATRVGAFDLNAGSKDAALIATLVPGVYSAKVTRAAGSATGLALVEVYDAGITPGIEDQKVVNISTRGEVRTADSIMIAGFVITGNVPKRVLIRGVGPTLAGFGVPDPLVNPIVKLYLGQTLVATNDDWGTSGDAAPLATMAAQVGAFPLDAGSKDAVILITLAPGIYSAQVSGVGGATGVVLLEVYEVP